MNMVLKIDSVDYSFLLPKKGYTVGYKPVLGSNSCYTQDGKFHEDVLAYKGVIKTELMPMTTEQLSAFSTAIINCKTATYFDTATKSVVTREVKATLDPASLVFNTPNKAFWSNSNRKGVILTIEER